MAELKRRAFLKLAGLAVFSPSLLKSKGPTKGLTNPVDIFQDMTHCPEFPMLREMRIFCAAPMIEGGYILINKRFYGPPEFIHLNNKSAPRKRVQREIHKR